MKRHPFDPPDRFDHNRLRQLLAERLGHPVDTLTSEPTVDDPGGVLILEHPDTGEHLDIDPVLVAEVVAQVAADPVTSIEERVAARFDAARTQAEKLDTFRAYLGERIERQRRARGEARRAREDLRRRVREVADRPD